MRETPVAPLLGLLPVKVSGGGPPPVHVTAMLVTFVLMTPLPWSTVKRVGAYLDAHPDATPTEIAKACQLTRTDALVAHDAYITEWYAEHLERDESAGQST